MHLSHSLRSAIDAWLSRALRLGASAFHDSSAVLERATIIEKSKDRAYVLLGDMFLGRRVFDKAIGAYEKAVK